MSHYLVQAAFTPESWATMVKNPQDRIAAVTPVVQNLGGKIECGYMAFGEWDIVAIIDLPDNVSAAAFAIAVASAGAMKAFRTTPLMDASDAQAAMRKAQSVGYEPPG
ncbi:MAG TPA: GYD domain-containing protein [Acidimicrobiales bacterium]|nr:GYD domain-containing protein [Acidimicrobiales bacterium]